MVRRLLSLQFKFELFEKKLLSAKAINLGSIEEIKVKATNHSHLNKIFFERNVTIASPIIAKYPSIFFGAYSYINEGGYLRENIFVGRYCSIGRRVSIGAGIHRSDSVSTSPFINNKSGGKYSDEQKQFLNIKEKAKNIVTHIHSDVWIGDGVVLMPGIEIGAGSIVAANAVVNSNVPSYAVVGGVPARIIRFRFPDSVISDLLSTEWWDIDYQTLQTMPTGNVLEFIDSVKACVNVSHSDFETYAIQADDKIT